MPLSTGTHLGPYEILNTIGAGGMGEIYRARDPRLGRDVAIKVLPAHLSQEPQALARFEREGRAVAALSHSNILAIFDVGTENGVSYAVTELLEGQSLRTRLTRGPVPFWKAAEIGIALAEGLAAAHSKGIVHRDLKPDNIFLTTDARVKILDFGVARLKPQVTSPGEGAAETEAGLVIGTVGYTAPEQVRGTGVTAVSDIFSLGCVLYEMFSGRRAFPGKSPAEIMSAILRDKPAELTAEETEIPGELNRLILHCLEKNPEERFQSARDLAFDLRRLVSVSTSSQRSSSGPTPDIDSIAVLPFVNASGDPDAEYLCDGISESIINSLAQVARLRVTPRTTVFRYKGHDPDLQAIGRELNARAVLTGRVTQRGETLVVGTELTDLAGGSQLWGERYTRKLSDLFTLEEDIARKISESLRMKLTGEEQKRMAKRATENSVAYQLYLKGRYSWNKRTPDALRKATEYFQLAIDEDPAYALAYAGLADGYSVLGIYGILPPKEGFARAKAAAAAAVAFDPELAEGHVSLAFVRSHGDWDWHSAEEEFQRAATLNPAYWVTPYWYAAMLIACGRFEDAEQQIARAQQLEPLSPVVAASGVWSATAARRYAEAIDRGLRALEIDPSYPLLRVWLGIAYECLEKYTEAIRELQIAVRLFEGASLAKGPLGHAYAAAGNHAAARELLRGLLESAERGTVDGYSIAQIYLGLGDTDRAIEWLDRSSQGRSGWMVVSLKVDPRLDELRTDPRFEKLLRRMNLVT